MTDNQRESVTRGKLSDDPNSLHNFHVNKRGPNGIPSTVKASNSEESKAIAPGHEYAMTQHISFLYYDQRISNAPFGYEHFVSLPPDYKSSSDNRWPLILFLHGSGESQRNPGESFLSVRHGVPKIILCYDKLVSGGEPRISIPRAQRLEKGKQKGQNDLSETLVPEEVCRLVAENFITVTPSLNMEYGYGWNSSILSALLDEIVERYSVDIDRIHVTGFSMGGYGTWELAMRTPERFASLVPICGGGDHLRATHLKDIPHWVHHGEKDDVIPVRASEQMVDALVKLGAEDVKLTTYPDLMHDSWTTAYSNPDVFRWMLECKRKVKSEEKATAEVGQGILSN